MEITAKSFINLQIHFCAKQGIHIISYEPISKRSTSKSLCEPSVKLVRTAAIVTIEFFTMGVSVRLCDRSLHKEKQKKFVKNCPQWGLKLGPPDLQANALPTELRRNLLHAPLHMLDFVHF